jgi:hypothetical protein
MNKMNEFLSKLPEMAFLIFSIRLAILGASIGDALALISVVAYIAYKQYIEAGTIKKSNEVNARLEELEKSISALKMDKVIQRGPQPNEQKTKRYF